MDTIDVVVGRIGKPHGVRGEVTVEVRTDEPEQRFADGTRLRAVSRDGAARTLTVGSTRLHQGVLLVRFDGVEGREGAESVRDLMLHHDLPRDATPEDPDEFYVHQLVGLDVVDLDGASIGRVTGLVPGGAQDLLAVRTPDGRDTLVPFVAALVPEVDLPGRRVVVADRPGLVAPLPEAPGTDG